jgi:hypothetical protein
MVRTSWSLVRVVHRRYSPQADHHDETVAHERRADHPERAPDAGAVDVSKDRWIRGNVRDQALLARRQSRRSTQRKIR